MEISKFQQAGDHNRETETNHNDESPTFDEEREDREIRENMRIMSISPRPTLFFIKTSKIPSRLNVLIFGSFQPQNVLKGKVMQIEKALINDRLRVSKVS